MGSIVEPMAVVHSSCVIGDGCIISSGVVVNHFSRLVDGAHVDCYAIVAGNTTVPDGVKGCFGDVYKKFNNAEQRQPRRFL